MKRDNDGVKLLLLVVGAFFLLATLAWVIEEKSGYADRCRYQKANVGPV
jgi:hypothetical protein